MNLPNVTPEAIPQQASAEAGVIEQSPIAEVIPPSPAQPQTVTTDDDQTSVPQPILGQDTADNISQEELADLTSSDVEQADDDWIGRVKDVIKDDEGQPFKEESDAEMLNEEYMKSRFNVDVDAPIEEK